jgi:hypothetical protein
VDWINTIEQYDQREPQFDPQRPPPSFELFMPFKVRQVEAVFTRICGEFESGKYWNLERGEEDML